MVGEGLLSNYQYLERLNEHLITLNEHMQHFWKIQLFLLYKKCILRYLTSKL